MTTFAASVTIVDLPTGTTVTGAELFEAVQTSSGVGQSVQLSLTQMLALGGLPTGGPQTIRNKSSGSNYRTTFSPTPPLSAPIMSLWRPVGNATSLTLAVAATGGIGSSQIGALAVQQSNVTAAAIGSTQLAHLRSSNPISPPPPLARPNWQPSRSARQCHRDTIGTSQMVTGVVGMTLLNTLTPNNVASTNDTTSLTNTAYRNFRILFR